MKCYSLHMNDEMMDRVMRQHARTRGADAPLPCRMGGILRGQPCSNEATGMIEMAGNTHSHPDGSIHLDGLFMTACEECSEVWIAHMPGDWKQTKAPIDVHDMVRLAHQQQTAGMN